MKLAARTGVAQRARERFADADYVDAFCVDAFCVEASASHSAEQWARTAIEGAPSGLRWFALAVQRQILRLRLGPQHSPDHVAGWAIAENTPETMVLYAASSLVAARLVIDASGSRTTLTTLVRYQRPAACGVWAVVGIAHRAVAAYLLGRAAQALAPHRQRS